MARPPKDKADRKDAELRIPVTEAQKAVIVEAAQQAGEDTAAWARRLLLGAAEEQPTTAASATVAGCGRQKKLPSAASH